MTFPLTDKDLQIQFVNDCFEKGMVTEDEYVKALWKISHPEDEELKKEYEYMAKEVL